VNEAFARTFPGTLLGRRLRSSPPRFQYGSAAAAEFAIVGIVRNERFRGLEQPAAPAYYLSTRQFPQSALTLLVRTHGDPLAAALEVPLRECVPQTQEPRSRTPHRSSTFSASSSRDGA
jgi:hypothetical protein